VIPKIQSPMPAFREKTCHRSPNSLRPGDAVFLAVGVQGPDLFVREVDDRSHGDIVS
jgi:hypothetical protein